MNVQFWISKGAKKRHAFVTFADARSASNCVWLSRENKSALHVNPMDTRNTSSYIPPQCLPLGIAGASRPTERPTWPVPPKPSSVESITPVARSHSDESKYVPSEDRQERMRHDNISLLPAEKPQSLPLPAAPLRQVDPRWRSPLTTPANSNGLRSMAVPLRPVHPLAPTFPPLGTDIFEHARLGTHRRADDAATSLRGDIANLRQDLRASRQARDNSLRDALEAKERYKAERDVLYKELRGMTKEADYYKAKGEDLAEDMADEKDSHRKKQEDLRNDLREANERFLKLKKDFDTQSQSLSQSRLELEESRCQLLAIKLKGTLGSTDLAADLEDAPFSSKATFSSVRPALEKALGCLEEIKAAMLMKEDERKPPEENGERPRKRQKR